MYYCTGAGKNIHGAQIFVYFMMHPVRTKINSSKLNKLSNVLFIFPQYNYVYTLAPAMWTAYYGFAQVLY